MSKAAHQIATHASGGVVSISIIRYPAAGSAKFTVIYQSRAYYWQSPHCFPEVGQAEAAAVVLGNFLGARVQL